MEAKEPESADREPTDRDVQYLAKLRSYVSVPKSPYYRS